ncbi:MAG TPA: aminotransferase class I/II-fold pyridoxal phosphate-dependent enzyme [Deferrisomatales bacterium]|nr:aminotransferase class I/II-fold pyridoxal phosphate-dependent enzyme [Deferrisomatales bacterium]
MASMTDRPLPVQDHGGNTRQVCARLGLEQVLDFSASINPLGQPPGLREHLFGHWDEVAHYPDRDCAALVAALAAHHGVPPECLVAGNGSAELLALLLRALSPRRLLLAPPDFGLYREVAPPGLPVLEVPRREQQAFALDVPALAAAVRPGDLVLLSNPGNPSGHYSPPKTCRSCTPHAPSARPIWPWTRRSPIFKTAPPACPGCPSIRT